MISFFLTLYRFGRAIWIAFADEEFRALFFLVAVLLSSGMFFYHGVEHMRYLDALYFSVTTLTTVGYGDFVPHTDLGKIFTMIYIFVGIGIILGFVDVVAKHAQMTKTPSLSSFLGNSPHTNTPNTPWFVAKRYGYGWRPVTWQGWACVLVYVLALAFLTLGVKWTAPTAAQVGFWFVPGTLLITGLLVWVAHKKSNSTDKN